MKIKKVKVSSAELINTGNYENKQMFVEFEAEVEKGESVNIVTAKLKERCDFELRKWKETLEKNKPKDEKKDYGTITPRKLWSPMPNMPLYPSSPPSTTTPTPTIMFSELAERLRKKIQEQKNKTKNK